MPARYNRNLVRVTNPSPTSGGSREEFPEVTQAGRRRGDREAQRGCARPFQAELDDPATLPEGTTVFPETAVIGELTPDVDPTTLVEQQVESFTLSLSGSGSAQAVDASPIEAIAAQRLEDAIGEGYELVDGSTTIDIGEGTRRRRRHHVPGRRQREAGPAARCGGAGAATCSGCRRRTPRRRWPSTARSRIVLWPGYVTSVPTIDGRVTVVVAPAVDPDAGSPTPSPRPTAAPAATDAPDASADARFLAARGVRHGRGIGRAATIRLMLHPTTTLPPHACCAASGRAA